MNMLLYVNVWGLNFFFKFIRHGPKRARAGQPRPARVRPRASKWRPVAGHRLGRAYRSVARAEPRSQIPALARPIAIPTRTDKNMQMWILLFDYIHICMYLFSHYIFHADPPTWIWEGASNFVLFNGWKLLTMENRFRKLIFNQHVFEGYMTKLDIQNNYWGSLLCV